ncbi:hypothetical protein [uncultured Tateyamaria sp.]|uniref:hypothetical protein n=1 Tax=uncultured Tateyamaria sp. TaxID=455651 RepID=UPI00260D1771|nr:hypothetical protein [uncultured Tateyamaria sp.]
MTDLLLDVMIRTEIESGNPQAGLKSEHTITLEVETGKLRKTKLELGKSDFGIFEASPFKFQNGFPEPVSKLRGDGTITLSVTGTTATPALIFPSIDYRFDLVIDPSKGSVLVSGNHDAYPSYSISIGKPDNQVYEFKHENLGLGGVWRALHGDGDDVKIENIKSSFPALEIVPQMKKDETKPRPKRLKAGGSSGGGGNPFGFGGISGGSRGISVGGGGCRSTHWEGNTVVCTMA